MACSPGSSPCCRADYNRSGGADIQDIFDYLNAWFSRNPATDYNFNGAIEIADIFEFIDVWFAGC